jgi:hypothetical protein
MGNINLSQICGPNYEKNQEIVTPQKDSPISRKISAESYIIVRGVKPRYNESEWERLRTTIVARNYFRHWKLEPLLTLVSSKNNLIQNANISQTMKCKDKYMNPLTN